MNVSKKEALSHNQQQIGREYKHKILYIILLENKKIEFIFLTFDESFDEDDWYLVLKKLSEEFLKLFSNIDKLKENNQKESAIV